jgi:hypothetical protein
MSLTSCGTALMMSTSLGTLFEPYLLATCVLRAFRLTVSPLSCASRSLLTISEHTRMVISALLGCGAGAIVVERL